MNEKNKTIEILFHDISYYYDSGIDMPESEEEHVKEMINKGFLAGELCYVNENTEEIKGYWEIDKYTSKSTLKKKSEYNINK